MGMPTIKLMVREAVTILAAVILVQLRDLKLRTPGQGMPGLLAHGAPDQSVDQSMRPVGPGPRPSRLHESSDLNRNLCCVEA